MNRENESMGDKLAEWFAKLFILALVMAPVLIVHLVTGAGFWMSLMIAMFWVCLFVGAIMSFIAFMKGK